MSFPKLQKTRGFDVDAFLAKAQGASATYQCREKQVVYLQGDPADAIFYIQKGKIKLTVISARGKEAVVAILGAGAFFGEGCLAGQRLRMAAAICMTECTVVRMEKEAALRLLRQERAFSDLFVAHLLTRNIRIEEDLVNHLFNSREKRLARVLLLLANYGKESKSELVIAGISQETLAEIVGTTRSRVSFFMNRFRKLGFVNYDSEGLQVHSSLLNVVLHD